MKKNLRIEVILFAQIIVIALVIWDMLQEELATPLELANRELFRRRQQCTGVRG